MAQVTKVQLTTSHINALASTVRAELAACQSYKKSGNKLEALAAAERLNRAVNDYVFELTK